MIERLRDERGIGLPMAMSVLVIVMLAAALTAANSAEFHRTSEKDRSAKRAQGAADAGVQRAMWRMAQTPAPAAGQCVVSTASGDALAAPVGGECVAAAGMSLGNGASTRFVVTPELAAGTACAGETVTVGERCVTTIGLVSGVQRRVQARFTRAAVPNPYTPVGLVGRTSVVFGNSITAYRCAGDPTASVGSNGTVTLGNGIVFDGPCTGSSAWGVTTMSPGGSVSGTATGATYATIPPPGFSIPPIDFGTTATVNNNATIGPGGVSWSGTRQLTVTGNVQLDAGTYNVCNLTIASGGTLTVRNGAVATILLDSPDRTGSGCAAGTGGFHAMNGVDVNWTGNDPTSAQVAARAPQLRLLVHGSTAWETGTRECNGNKAGAVLICNSSRFAGLIYAPSSKVVLSNSVDFVGAIAADRIDAENSVRLRFPPGMETITPSTTPGSARVSRWTECRDDQPVAGDPESGCA